MGTNQPTSYHGTICATGATVTVPAQQRGGKRITRIISAVRVTMVQNASPAGFTCTNLIVVGNGEPNAGAVAATAVRLNAGAQNQLVFGTALTAFDFVSYHFESDDVPVHAITS